MRGAARKELDRIDAMKVGTGSLEAFVFGAGNLDGGTFGAGLDYQHRLTERSSAFVHADVGHQYGEDRGLNFNLLGGWRTSF